MHAKKLAVEFIGTFFLVFTIGMTVLNNPAGVIAPLAIGAILMAMIFAGGHISGAHYNPAVTLAVLIRGKISAPLALGYIIIQVVAGAVAAGAVFAIKNTGPATPAEVGPFMPIFAAEFIFTFALAWVVLNVATAKGTTGNSFYGLAIGFTVLAGAFAVGAVSGGAFNPAVVIGATIMGLVHTSMLWVYLLANFTGAAAAAVIFHVVNDELKD